MKFGNRPDVAAIGDEDVSNFRKRRLRESSGRYLYLPHVVAAYGAVRVKNDWVAERKPPGHPLDATIVNSWVSRSVYALKLLPYQQRGHRPQGPH